MVDETGPVSNGLGVVGQHRGRARRYLYYIVNDRIMKESVTPSPYLAEMGLSIPTTLPEA